eukprot:1226929-Amorphochlora_amoeboformis.AAC.1
MHLRSPFRGDSGLRPRLGRDAWDVVSVSYPRVRIRRTLERFAGVPPASLAFDLTFWSDTSSACSEGVGLGALGLR